MAAAATHQLVFFAFFSFLSRFLSSIDSSNRVPLPSDLFSFLSRTSSMRRQQKKRTKIVFDSTETEPDDERQSKNAKGEKERKESEKRERERERMIRRAAEEVEEEEEEG